MGMIWRFTDHDIEDVMAGLKKGVVPFCTLVHRPVDNEGRDSYWPWGVAYKEGSPDQACGWFEEPGMMLTWGANPNVQKLLACLEAAGFRLLYEG